MRKQNIILFSSGVSERNGILQYVKDALEQDQYVCSYWRDLFRGANDESNIALLPMLIKMIPTFDFAVLICEGHDETYMFRNAKMEKTYTMRDNVLFEIGLCAMALGLNRVILLTDGSVRLPEDLQGIGKETAIKTVSYVKGSESSYLEASGHVVDYLQDIMQRLQDPALMTELVGDIERYIHSNIGELYPTVIGASVSTANGYMTNFILRTLEKCNEGVALEEDGGAIRIVPDDKIFMHIVLPMEYTAQTPARCREKTSKLPVGTVPTARIRKAEFRYVMKGDELHIYDYPTTLVTEYQTARIILAIDADDHSDAYAEKRFNAKELDLFESALRSFMCEPFIRATVEHFYEDDTKEEEDRMVERLVAMMSRVEIVREDY